MGMAEQPTRRILVIDVRDLPADAQTLETLARLQLAVRRAGASIELRHACPGLCSLLAWSGLADLLPQVPDSGVERDGLVEQREELFVDEEVDRGDPSV
jgi:hypothetical protein